METTNEARSNRDAPADVPSAERAAGRTGLSSWQAQGIALAVTVGAVAVVVLLFDLLARAF